MWMARLSPTNLSTPLTPGLHRRQERRSFTELWDTIMHTTPGIHSSPHAHGLVPDRQAAGAAYTHHSSASARQFRLPNGAPERSRLAAASAPASLQSSPPQVVWQEMQLLDCAPRTASHRPFAKSGAPVQYVHLPKAGGMTIQTQLECMARANGIATHIKNNNNERTTGMQNGSLYMGHHVVGWGAAPTSHAFTLVSWRDPLSLVLSLYGYKASFAGNVGPAQHIREVQYLRSAEAAMRVRGVAADAMFDTLLREGDSLAWEYAHSSSSHFLLPLTCLVDKNSLSAKAIMLKNLARIQVVVMSERLSVQLQPQLRRHAPWLDTLMSGSCGEKKVNVAHRKPQVLSENVSKRMMASSAFQWEVAVSAFAARVAEARTAQHDGSACAIGVSSEEKMLLGLKLSPELEAACLLAD